MTKGAGIVWWVLAAFLALPTASMVYAVLSSVDATSLPLNGLLYVLGRVAGLIGFVFLSFLIFFGDMARFFDRYFGLDRIIIFNRRFSLATAVFVLFHPVFFALSGSPGLGYFLPDFAVFPVAAGVIAFYIMAAVMVASAIYKRIPNSGWQIIHILTYALFFMAIYHAASAGTDYSSAVVKAVYGFMLFAVAVGIIYRTRYKIMSLGVGRATVEELKWETKDTFTLTLRPKHRVASKPGQFCFLRLDRERLYARHPFTVASPPQEDTLRFTIKLQGRFTKAASQLRKGDEVGVEGPFGIFTLTDEPKEVVLVAGGVGITPFIAMIRDQIKSGKERKMLLIYGSRKFDGIIFKEELEDVKGDWLRRVYVLSEDDAGKDLCEAGYVDDRIIKKYVQDIDNAVFYICGPEMMKKCVKDALGKLKVDKDNIKVEDFFW